MLEDTIPLASMVDGAFVCQDGILQAGELNSPGPLPIQ
jgi:hypothetical protein